MYLMNANTTFDTTVATVGDVQGVRRHGIEWWTRQTLGFHEDDYLSATVESMYDYDQITMTATVTFWS